MVAVEAVVGFVSRAQAQDKAEKGTPVATKVTATTKALVPRRAAELTANDRRFLRSLRIAADDANVEETN